MRLLKLLAVLFTLSLALFAAGSPFSGTWKLDRAKSTPPEPKSDIAVVDVDDNGIRFSEDVVDDKGQPLKISYEAKFDGKDYPVTGVPDTDSVSYRRVNAYGKLLAWQPNVQRPIKRSGSPTSWRRSQSVVLNRGNGKKSTQGLHPSRLIRPLIRPRNLGQTWDKNPLK